ncbi:TetR family transcriptional regulator [Alisedimentitalea sp. MJ-SS2]|uniref:TetR family transcriptional regulator n=1 Tax=Aliisedimentitalea sp. MJ-SS2 TaxID=3049795 RepID=UPI00290A018B|nr:TetR family transcriptional regulator [Alisedimentitalea sp. MJ-SS2]MDU8929948.1 TetR family transcriptional regulator [Alisedimentitalea sp. MJ-SS2]
MSGLVKTSKRNPEANRSALIRATLDSIYEDGFAETTVSGIIKRAGLSRGMIHLHFGGKSQLLVAAAEAFNIEYYAEIDRHLLVAADTPEATVMAVVSADLSEALLNERSAKLLHAFRGAATTDAGIAQFSGTRDEKLRTIVRGAFEEIAQAYEVRDSSILARDATFGLLAMLEGMWGDYLLNPTVFSHGDAKHIACRFLKGLFPDHFETQRCK